MELTEADLNMICAMFGILVAGAAVEHVTAITITFHAEGGDVITIGYGETGDPAVLCVEPASTEPTP